MESLESDRLRRLIEVGRSLMSELDLETLLQRMLEVARELTGARYAAFGILDDRREELERFLTVGIDEAERRAIGDLPRGRGVLGELIAHPVPLRLDDVELHPRSYGFPIGHPEMHTFLGVPIVIRGSAWGNLYLTEKAGGAEFSEADEAALVVLADWAAIAIENARLYQDVRGRRDELERAVRTLEATSEVTRAVGGELQLERILELIAKRGRALVEARAVLISLRDGDELHVVAAAGKVPADVRASIVPVDGSLAGETLKTRQARRVEPGSTGLRAPWAKALGAQAELVVPLIFRDRSLGVIAAFDCLGRSPTFSADDEQLMLAFAASAATAVATGQHVVAEGTRRSLEASERERGRWARELHDETLQEMGALKLVLSAARRSDDLAALHSAIEGSVEQLTGAIERLRALITDLRPAALDQLGPGPALEALAERVERQSGVGVSLQVDLAYESGRAAARHTPEAEATIYRVIQEALTNAVKHADASRIEVAVREDDEGVEIVVRDDGRGFETGATAATSEGFGLLGMRERIALAGGTLAVASSPGNGTEIRARVPGRRRPGDARPVASTPTAAEP
jgi:two-component system, NarL family, sensor histidine kinase DevS